MRILLSAYACEPGRGSEPEVGLQALMAAASQHEVWLLTRANNVVKLEAFLAQKQERHRIHLIPIEGPRWAMANKNRFGVVGIQLYYDLWQRSAGRAARMVDFHSDIEVAHHVTFASAWARIGIASLGKPLIIGPVGGGVDPPIRALSVLGIKGVVRDLFRYLIRSLWMQLPSFRRAISGATQVLAQNPETARALAGARSLHLLPNGISGVPELVTFPSERSNEVVVVGRLIPYKAVILAVEAFAALANRSLRLVIVGNGPEEKRVRDRVKELGLLDVVEFAGPVPRQQVFQRVAAARALLHAALHDDSPLTVAEALALGTPVVCIDRGGAPLIAEYFPSGLMFKAQARGGRREIAKNLAHALERALELDLAPASAVTSPRVSFGDAILGSYEAVLAERLG